MTFLKMIENAIAAARAEMPGEPVGWQWFACDTWHTVDKSQVADPEAYAKSFGFPVRAIYAGPALETGQ